jgi:hypothetical protein
MMRFTLDTTCVIHAAQGQRYGPQIDELVDLARSNRVGLWITTAFTVDQETASPENLRCNLEWLSQRPVIGLVRGPFRLDYSRLGVDQLVNNEQQAVDEIIREIMLPKADKAKNLQDDDETARAKRRRKVSDTQHLAAHFLAGHDAFVTDDRDMLSKNKRKALRERAGIVVIDPVEAVETARSQ